MKKGFTLIELLAVIVILAIIAVIAVPIVIDIIEDAKINSVKSSANMYLKAAELYISNAELNKVKINPGTYSITEDGNICIGIIEDNKCNGEEIKIEVKGNKPNSGQIIIDENTNIKIDYLEINGYVYYKHNDKYIVEKGTKNINSSDNGLITIDSSKTGELSNYRIYGNNYQETRSGKNLFNYKEFVDNAKEEGAGNSISIIDRGIKMFHMAYQEKYSKLNLNLKENTVYTLSADINWVSYNDDRVVTGFILRYDDGTHSNVEIGKNTTKINFTSEIGKTIVAISSRGWQYQGEVNITNIQLEEGTEATEYESYIGMPSTEYPSEIQSVGDYNEETKKYEIPIRVTGKNIFKVGTIENYIQDAYSNLNIEENKFSGTVRTGAVSYFYNIKIKYPSGQYTISADFEGESRHLVKCYDERGNPLTSENISIAGFTYNTFYEGWFVNDKTKTVIIPDDVSYWIWGSVFMGDVGKTQTISNVQIEVGNNSTKYEPYKEENYKIELEEPLRCVGEVCDYIDYESGKIVRYIEEVDNTGIKTIEESFVVLSKPVIENIELPKINLNEGVSNIFIETDTKPSKTIIYFYN